MADVRNLGYMVPNQGNGWETKYDVDLADRDNIEVVEHEANGNVAPIVYYFGSATVNKALLDLYLGFPIGTLFINRTVYGIYIKKDATTWNSFDVTLVSA
jgi:hypothetical protein